MCPKFVSHEGVWYPAKERIALKNLSDKPRMVDGKEVKPGDDYIYEGADRAALFELYQQKVETLGQNFRQDPEFLKAMRAQNYNSVDEYLKATGYDQEKSDKEFEEKAEKVHRDEMPKRVKSIESLGGGVDTSGGGQDRYGGFGHKPND